MAMLESTVAYAFYAKPMDNLLGFAVIKISVISYRCNSRNGHFENYILYNWGLIVSKIKRVRGEKRCVGKLPRVCMCIIFNRLINIKIILAFNL